MNNEELLTKMNRVKNDLDNARRQLVYAQSILNRSITFNNEGFKSNDISNFNIRLNNQIYNINYKINPGIYNM